MSADLKGPDLKGKVAIVTGGARGIGKAYVEGLVRSGAAVLIADILEDRAAETAAAVRAAGGHAAAQRLDVIDPASVKAMAEAAVSQFGGIDILVNNAAAFGDLKPTSFADLDIARWDRTMAINLRGPLLCIQAVAPHMRARGGGAIVNIASIAAFGMAGMLDYSTSKAAVIGLTKNVSLELGRDNIRINAIAPGGVATEAAAGLTGGDAVAFETRTTANQSIKSPLRPESMVGPMLYLVSDASALMTGQTLIIDGGRYFLG
jgi:NAD(P)-dependent dehydrogenase (short-subunit alcohol dehydrogenase family)